MKGIVVAVIGIVTLLIILYVGLYWGLIQPIMVVADAIDSNTITAGLVAEQLIRFIVREFIMVIIGFVGYSSIIYILSK